MNKSDMKWAFGILITLIVGLKEIWTFNISPELIIPIIKIIFTIFWVMTIAIAIYFIIIRKRRKNVKK